MSAGGKGHDPRPYSVDEKTFADNFDKTFGKREPKPQWVPPPLPQGLSVAEKQQPIKLNKD
jgi:hypothetical protein